MPRKSSESAVSWSKSIATQFGNTIPIIHKVPKGQEQHHFNFSGLAKDYELAMSMAFKSKKFSTSSDVLRAAIHLGLHVLYHLVKIEDIEYREQAGKIVHLSSTMEQTFYRANVMDDLLKDLEYMKHCIKLGLLTQEEFDAKLETLFADSEKCFDESFRKSLEHNLDQLNLGKSSGKLSACRQHGGNRE